MEHDFSRKKIIYNSLMLIFMLYLLGRSLFSFAVYLFNGDKLLAGQLNLKYITHTQVKMAAVEATLPEGCSLATPSAPMDSVFSIICTIEKPEEHQKQSTRVSEAVRTVVADSMVAKIQKSYVPPAVSKRIRRLELSVFIPAFLIACVWLFSFFKWLIAFLKFRKTAPVIPVPSAKSKSRKK
ncbi:hypothetical protein KAH55_05205 [bacterium]|nr:hypothetical protein [bacterium]